MRAEYDDRFGFILLKQDRPKISEEVGQWTLGARMLENAPKPSTVGGIGESEHGGPVPKEESRNLLRC